MPSFPRVLLLKGSAYVRADTVETLGPAGGIQIKVHPVKGESWKMVREAITSTLNKLKVKTPATFDDVEIHVHGIKDPQLISFRRDFGAQIGVKYWDEVLDKDQKKGYSLIVKNDRLRSETSNPRYDFAAVFWRYFDRGKLPRRDDGREAFMVEHVVAREQPHGHKEDDLATRDNVERRIAPTLTTEW